MARTPEFLLALLDRASLTNRAEQPACRVCCRPFHASLARPTVCCGRHHVEAMHGNAAASLGLPCFGWSVSLRTSYLAQAFDELVQGVLRRFEASGSCAKARYNSQFTAFPFSLVVSVVSGRERKAG
ncbi:hypothetical protein L1887_53598 [Cichorium endivia]|nr:hypothetical protein L1887_53598 [Cichorium endivia]